MDRIKNARNEDLGLYCEMNIIVSVRTLIETLGHNLIWERLNPKDFCQRDAEILIQAGIHIKDVLGRGGKGGKGGKG